MSELPDLISFTKAHNINFFITGAGSNTMFHDLGYRGLIIRILAKEIKIEGTEITADAGVMIPKLIKASVEAGLAGLEPWMGLPGTVGGAVRGNAGCNGLETKEILKYARIFDPDTLTTTTLSAPDLNMSYRHTKLKDQPAIVLSATFTLKKLDKSPEEQEKDLNKYRMFRLTKQPFGSTTGSFFKNPSPDKPAGMLIDQAGLKGYCIGKACISDKHANFFLNKGGATFKEMLALVHKAQATVKEKFDIDLESEVQIVMPST